MTDVEPHSKGENSPYIMPEPFRQKCFQSTSFVVFSFVTLLLTSLGLSGCLAFGPTPTPTPTKTPRPIPSATAEISPTPSVTAHILPTATATPVVTTVSETSAPSPSASPTPEEVREPEPSPTLVPTMVTPTDTPAPTATLRDTPAPAPAPTATPVEVPVAPPQRGGEWDMEAGFYEWASPYENFVGHVANGWHPFVKAYDENAVPRFNENKFGPNIHRGQRSQEISFDYRSGEMGLWRRAEVQPGHRYTIEAWAKYSPSPNGLYLYLGIDLGGGSEHEAGSVTWCPWRDQTADQWIPTRETVRATGPFVSIFLRAVHPMAEPGGNTMFDNVSLIDEGP